jgi:hypothetical protein
MKIKLEFDITAKEVRQVIGLPDVERLQKEVVDAIREKMVAGVEGFDPLTLLRSFMPWNLPGFESAQKAFMQLLAMASERPRRGTP